MIIRHASRCSTDRRSRSWPRTTSSTRSSTGSRALVSRRAYQKRWLHADLVAGLVLAAILVPQGMAYAELAGLPAVTGLYTTIACLVAYAVFGPSRILVLGPDSSVSPMIFAAIVPLLATNDPATADRARRHVGDPGRRHLHRARDRQARLRRRPALERGAGRLHERARHHHHRGAAAQALRLLHRRRRLRGGDRRVLPRARRHRRHDTRRRRVRARRAAGPAPTGAPRPRHPRRGRRRHGGVSGGRPGLRRRRDRRGPSPGHAASERAMDADRATSARSSSRPSASPWCRSPTRSRRQRASRRGGARRSTPTRR